MKNKILFSAIIFSLVFGGLFLVKTTTQAKTNEDIPKVKKVRMLKKGNKFITVKWNKVKKKNIASCDKKVKYRAKMMNNKKKKLRSVKVSKNQ
ncbi:MAG: hypothetical protein ABID45_04620, partial [Patescibacteria group bacterium]